MSDKRTIAVVTGSRAEYGLLRPVMHAINAHPSLELHVIVTGTHHLRPALTAQEVNSEFVVAQEIRLQMPGATGRFADAAALGEAILGLAKWLQVNTPDVMLVLGDRIEAFAAAAAAAVGGIRVAHMHGGDRAEGIADEALRHAITKLAHLHLPATKTSADRIKKMGEDPKHIHIVGSPAIDGLDEFQPLPDEAFDGLGRPEILFLLHPRGGSQAEEQTNAEDLLGLCRQAGRVLAMHPNHDHGREGIMDAISHAGVTDRAHLARGEFIGLLRRVKLLVGNSSAGLIECAALGVRCINVGSRQAGREMPDNVIDVSQDNAQRCARAIKRGLCEPPGKINHPYGDGRAGPRTAEFLAAFEPRQHPLVKRNSY